MRAQRGIQPSVAPAAAGCQECLQTGGWWLQLRRCATCGHIGCCDTSPGQHALRHAHDADHPIVASFEPLQRWFYDYERADVVRGPRLSPPYSHPIDQPSPGPAGMVPANWESLLHYDI